MGKPSKAIILTDKQRIVLNQIATSRTHRQDHIDRANIILLCTDSKNNNVHIAKTLGIHKITVANWRKKWQKNENKLKAFDLKENGIFYTRKLLEMLSDEQRSGHPCKFTAEEVCKIISLSCELPADSDLPLSHWSLDALVIEIKKRGIVENISRSRLAVFLKSGGNKPAQG